MYVLTRGISCILIFAFLLNYYFFLHVLFCCQNLFFSVYLSSYCTSMISVLLLTELPSFRSFHNFSFCTDEFLQKGKWNTLNNIPKLFLYIWTHMEAESVYNNDQFKLSRFLHSFLQEQTVLCRTHWQVRLEIKLKTVIKMASRVVQI